MSAVHAAVEDVLGSIGLAGVSAGEVELIAEAVVGLVTLLGGAAQKRAAEAGLKAAAQITNADEAERAESERR